MRLEVYRDSREGMELVGAFASTDFGIRFFYDVRYVQRGEEKGEFGISETMPLDFGHYEPQEYAFSFSKGFARRRRARQSLKGHQVLLHDFRLLRKARMREHWRSSRVRCRGIAID